MTNDARPLGPAVDPLPRPVPARTPLPGTDAVLEPLHRRHAPELWEAARHKLGDASWDYLAAGPFPNEAAFTAFVADLGSRLDCVAWAVRPVATGLASGFLTLMDIQPGNAAIEIGNIWFAPRMQRTRAATEALYLAMRLAMEDLGYRRLVWKCNALNAPSRSAADRLGFTYEGTLRAHMVTKGRRRDTAMYSMLDTEWPSRRDALLAWLAPENAAPDGTTRRGLAELRALTSAA